MKLLAALALLPFLLSQVSAQQFQRDTASIPASTGYTENVDFADVDNDGDWDAAFANGGDFGNQQSRLWQNQGGAQGGTLGVFSDVTATNFPALLCDSRDIEFADLDADGDVDLFLSDTSSLVNQTSRFWINQAGTQGGSAGFFQDDTAARWLGLGQPGSSIPPGQVLGSGGYVEFSNDSDFADLDNDGDLDLVFSTGGGAFLGNAPTRIFLNDGGGRFAEYNPSGFQLAGQAISNGNPGLWCEGTQLSDTTNSSGVNCDIATSCVDLDLGDVDGDFDIDLLLGARTEVPRLFQNRWAEKFGVLGFRDVTGASFTSGYALGNGHYAQEFGDMDSDGDWDILGINWLVQSVNFNDATYLASGGGNFGAPTTLASSTSDDSEGDFLDYDGDGDLDIFVANFSGQERVYRNNGGANYTFMSTGSVLPSDSTTSLDADECDVDGDGDQDVFVANDANQAEWFLRNGGAAADTTAPAIVRVEQVGNRIAGPGPTVVRAEIVDNAAYYANWYMQVHLSVQPSGSQPFNVPMRCSMAQVFRGAIPGNLVGSVNYTVVATDEHGNSSSSALFNYSASSGSLGLPFCLGDGSLPVACPCVNIGTLGRGCDNSSASGGALLTASGAVQPDSVVFQCSGLPANVLVVFLQSAQTLGTPQPFGDGLRCIGGTMFRMYLVQASGTSATAPAPGLPGVRARSGALGDVLGPGAQRSYQAWYRDPSTSFCPAPTGNVYNVSGGLQIAW